MVADEAVGARALREDLRGDSNHVRRSPVRRGTREHEADDLTPRSILRQRPGDGTTDDALAEQLTRWHGAEEAADERLERHRE